jgi:hypothetical protein
MRTAPAGDFDYDNHGQGYAHRRRTDPRISKAACCVRLLLPINPTGQQIGLG